MINSVSPQSGSLNGGTFLTIAGQYFYNDANIPAVIDIAGYYNIIEKFWNKNIFFNILKVNRVRW